MSTGTATRTIRSWAVTRPGWAGGGVLYTEDADKALDAALEGYPVRRAAGWELGFCDCPRCTVARGEHEEEQEELELDDAPS